jgi:hypothetical protein
MLSHSGQNNLFPVHARATFPDVFLTPKRGVSCRLKKLRVPNTLALLIISLALNSLVLGLLASSFPAFGSETIFTNLNCAVTFPAGWHRAPAPADATNYYAIGKSPDETRSVVVHIRSLGYRHTPIDQEFKRDGIRAFKEEGSLLSERDITVSGQAAWELAGELPFEGRKVTTVSPSLICWGQSIQN